MNYLLFAYYDDTVENSEEKTNQIAKKISNSMTSKEIKFMFGDKHAIFHFASDLNVDEMGEIMNIILFELMGFDFLLTQKTKNNFSSFPDENIEHLLTLRKTSPKKKTNPSKSGIRTNDIRGVEGIFGLEEFIAKLKSIEVCNLTLDELLDKILDQGVESLTEVEKKKLDEYSKSI
jgi:hypothetical protein